jgi:hypothetical protein
MIALLCAADRKMAAVDDGGEWARALATVGGLLSSGLIPGSARGDSHAAHGGAGATGDDAAGNGSSKSGGGFFSRLRDRSSSVSKDPSAAFEADGTPASGFFTAANICTTFSDPQLDSVIAFSVARRWLLAMRSVPGKRPNPEVVDVIAEYTLRVIDQFQMSLRSRTTTSASGGMVAGGGAGSAGSAGSAAAAAGGLGSNAANNDYAESEGGGGGGGGGAGGRPGTPGSVVASMAANTSVRDMPLSGAVPMPAAVMPHTPGASAASVSMSSSFHSSSSASSSASSASSFSSSASSVSSMSGVSASTGLAAAHGMASGSTGRAALLPSYAPLAAHPPKIYAARFKMSAADVAHFELQLESALIEALGILDLLCRTDEAMVPRFFPVVRRLHTHFCPGMPNPHVPLATLRFLVRHGRAMVLDVDPLLEDAFRAAAIRGWQWECTTAHELISFVLTLADPHYDDDEEDEEEEDEDVDDDEGGGYNTGRDDCWNDAWDAAGDAGYDGGGCGVLPNAVPGALLRALARHAPVVLQCLAWSPAVFADVAQPLIPLLIGDGHGVAEILHAVLDLPVATIAMETIAATRTARYAFLKKIYTHTHTTTR